MSSHRLFLFLAAVLLTLVFVGLVAQGAFVAAILVACALLGARFLLRPDLLAYATVFLLFARVFFPFAGRMIAAWWPVALLSLISTGLLTLNTRQKVLRERQLPQRAALAFLCITAVIGAIRGVGFRAMGAEASGGQQYVYLWTALLFFDVTSRLDLPPLRARTLIATIGFGSLLYLVAERAVALWNPIGLRYVFDIITSDLAIPGAPGVIDGSAGSLALLNDRSRAYLYCGIGVGWLLARSGGSAARSFGLMLVEAALALASGFRSDLVFLFLLTMSVWFRLIRGNSTARVMILALALTATACIYGVLPMLPNTMQRSLSVVMPNRVDTAVKDSAIGSLAMRSEVYRYTLRHCPQYLIVGRGLGLTMDEIYRTQMRHVYDTEHHYLRHSYHLGVFSFLMDTGVIGLLCFLLLVYGVLGRRPIDTEESEGDLEAEAARYGLLVCRVFLLYTLFLGEDSVNKLGVYLALMLIPLCGAGRGKDRGADAPAGPQETGDAGAEPRPRLGVLQGCV